MTPDIEKLIVRLRGLCGSEAEVMSDGARLTAFVNVGMEAADALASLVRERDGAFELAAQEALKDNTPGYGPHRADMEALAENQRRAIAERIRSLSSEERQ